MKKICVETAFILKKTICQCNSRRHVWLIIIQVGTIHDQNSLRLSVDSTSKNFFFFVNPTLILHMLQDENLLIHRSQV